MIIIEERLIAAPAVSRGRTRRILLVWYYYYVYETNETVNNFETVIWASDTYLPNNSRSLIVTIVIWLISL
jgi:hypothetical protein